MADILYKDFKTTFLKMLKELKDDVKKIKKIMCKQNENITKNLKRNPKELLELESTVTEMKNP